MCFLPFALARLAGLTSLFIGRGFGVFGTFGDCSSILPSTSPRILFGVFRLGFSGTYLLVFDCLDTANLAFLGSFLAGLGAH